MSGFFWFVSFASTLVFGYVCGYCRGIDHSQDLHQIDKLELLARLHQAERMNERISGVAEGETNG